ncbi:hypothetical protein TUM19329_32430 [Legionella antarctica]|uniref:SidC homolog n=1 Tax=Legionella antarctica TaxID=2708020 RepID=A0A6F8T9Z3_9GAMM|nr:F-box protein [Legionella antarctica]BCA96882.1 hypothetical protein TUM19329_32430 [Legionella antarctica]
MQSKFEEFEEFNELPAQTKIETAQNLSNRDLLNLAQTSRSHSLLFKPVIDVRKLLHHVTRGEHDAVKAMLKKDTRLIFKRGVVTDCSGRAFDNISGFEYALWALDKHMWAMMLECIDQDEEGRKVFEQLIVQYDKVNKNGVTYKLNGNTITEQHFDFKNSIIKELQMQIDSINAHGTKDWDAIEKQWREGVGGAQKKFPIHVVDEYCSDQTFSPVPKFTSQPESSKQFYNWTTGNEENWFGLDSKLGGDFAIYKGLGCDWRSCVGEVRAAVLVCAVDLGAMVALCEIRTNDFINLKSRLGELMTVDKQPQIYQM